MCRGLLWNQSLKPTASCFSHGLQPGPEPDAGIDEGLLVHVGHCLNNGSPQGVNSVMCAFVGLSLQDTPHIVVQWVQVQQAGGPHLLWPEHVQIVQTPILDKMRGICQSTILLEDVWPSSSHHVHPGFAHVPHDIQVDLLVDILPLGKEVWGHDITLTGNKEEDVDWHWKSGPSYDRDFSGSCAIYLPFLLLTLASTQMIFSSEQKQILPAAPCFREMRSLEHCSTLLIFMAPDSICQTFKM